MCYIIKIGARYTTNKLQKWSSTEWIWITMIFQWKYIWSQIEQATWLELFLIKWKEHFQVKKEKEI